MIMVLLTKLRRFIRTGYYRVRMLFRLALLPIYRRRFNTSCGYKEINLQRSVYIFFSPEAGVSSHFAANCLIAKTLQDLGHQVLMVRCFDTYHHCLTIEMNHIPLDRSSAQRADVCISCAQSGQKMTHAYDLPTITLHELLTDNELSEIKALVNLMPADASKFELDNIKFGTLCGMDVALLTKKLDQLNVTGIDRAYLEAYVEAAIISYRAMQKIIARFKVARLLYFNEYSMLMGAVVAAKRHAVPVVRISHAIHKNYDRSKIILMSDPLAIINYHNCLDRWPLWRNLPITAKIIELITDNQLARMGAVGFSVYSPKFSAGERDIFLDLGLNPERKLLVAYTSSLDEYFSNIHLMNGTIGVSLFQQEQPFIDQIAWISSLINYVERSAHLQLVVRIHPREGVTARESVASEHRDLLAAQFSKNYQHTRIIWPEDSISSYDLAEVADIALTSWTNITSEVTRLGVPTITAFKRVNPFPINDMVGWAPTPKEYFALIESMLLKSVSLDPIRYAYRWSHLAFLSSYVDFGDIVPSQDYQGLPPYHTPKNANLVERVVCYGESLQDIRYEELTSGILSTNVDEELDELRRQLRRVVWYLITGAQPVKDFILRNGFVATATDGEVVVEVEGEYLKISIQGRVLKKRSKAILRLLPLIVNS